jgi:hypothetical protein
MAAYAIQQRTRPPSPPCAQRLTSAARASEDTQLKITVIPNPVFTFTFISNF